jgi:hypothetical protein
LAAMVRTHSWERGASAPVGAAPASSAAPGDDSQATAPAEVEVEGEDEKKVDAGEQLADLLLQLHIEGRLSAKDTCCISYWATKAGAQGPVKTFAYKPTAPTGHFQRHLDRVGGLRGSFEKFVSLSVPGHTRANADRVTQEVKAMPPHECLHREFVEDPTILGQIRPREWPLSFHQHPVIRSAQPGQVLPLAFYMDAAQYTKGGAAVLVFVVANLVSGTRHLVAVLKKKDFCRCGCRGWCSLRPVFAFLDWSFQALARGIFPAEGCDGQPWAASADPTRRSMAGLPLALRAAVVQVKGDWAEYSHSLGFPTWRHMEYPCIWCRCERDTLYAFSGMRPGELPWDPTDPADYDAACAMCERHVFVRTVGQRDRLAALLFYDKRTIGSHGRALKQDAPEFNLLAGDRLEPCAACPDVGGFEELALPATIVFWRPSQETVAKHRNPLFNAATGITTDLLTVDTLHCLYLGVLQVHCSRVVWSMVEADVWDTRSSGHTTAPARLQESCTRLQADLAQWCRKRLRTHPHERVTMVQEITPYILGASADDQKLGLKGGETKTMFLFLHELLLTCTKEVRMMEHMVAASKALLRHVELLSEAPRTFAPSQAKDFRLQGNDQHLCISMSRFLGTSGIAAPPILQVAQEFHTSQLAALEAMRHYVAWTPKFHQWLHICRTGGEPNGELQIACLRVPSVAFRISGFTINLVFSPRHGENPSYHSCWLDESDNKRIMRIAASCHRRVFETRVLSSWALVQQGGWYKCF